MNDKSVPPRYKYSSSYADPEKLHFGSDWMSEEACRTAVARMLGDSTVRRDSIHVVVQHKKSRWLPLKWGPAVELFPEIVAEVTREAAVHAVVHDPSVPPQVRFALVSALKRGVPEALAEARQLVAALERIQAVVTS